MASFPLFSSRILYYYSLLLLYCCFLLFLLFFFFFNDPATPEIYTLSLHDALPIWSPTSVPVPVVRDRLRPGLLPDSTRSEEHTSELQSRRDLVCSLLLEKKKK